MSDTKGNKSKIRPLQDRIIVERIESEEKTTSGLFILILLKKNLKRAKSLHVAKARLRMTVQSNL